MITYNLIKDVFDLDNPLTLEYFDLCSKDTDDSIYFEKHHILPRSMFPEFTKAEWNIVKLSYADHYRAHELLAQICLKLEHRQRMLSAWYLLSNTRIGVSIDAEKYAELRKTYVLLHSGSNSPFYGTKLSKEHRYRISESNKGENHWLFGKSPNIHPMFGKKHSDKSKKLMSDAKIGKPLPDEHYAKLSLLFCGAGNPFYGKKHSEDSKKLMSINNFMLGKCGVLHHNYGMIHTEESKRLISKACSGRKYALETVMKRADSASIYKYEQYDLNNNFIRIWTSFEITKHEVFNTSHVTSVCLGKRRTHGGFIWRRVLK